MMTSMNSRLAIAAFAFLAGLMLGGCIADTAEDTSLPWATSQSWEGIAPIAPSVTDRYD